VVHSLPAGGAATRPIGPAPRRPPYERIGLDADGRAGIEWGISGVPETFIVDSHGVVRGRFGPLDPDNVESGLLPAIDAASR
jgi:cytochrome c biogenesis protein CcmG/thiol:disulfide interchange protein DsbE